LAINERSEEGRAENDQRRVDPGQDEDGKGGDDDERPIGESVRTGL